MIIGTFVTTFNLAHLDQQQVNVYAKFYHQTEKAWVLPGAWSRELRFEIPRNTPGLDEVLETILAYVIPRERAAWEHFPEVVQIALYHVDFMRYDGTANQDWGLAVNYHRLDATGTIIEGFAGDSLFKVQQGTYWGSGEGEEVLAPYIVGPRGAEFNKLKAPLFKWAERLLDDRLGYAGGGL